MKTILIISFFHIGTTFSQSAHFPLYSIKLKKINYMQLERMVALDRQREHVAELKLELERAKQNGVITERMIFELQEQNKVLRQRMLQYVREIDELNKRNEEIRENSEKSE